MKTARPIIHGRDHGEGGADVTPIKRRVVAQWAGTIPTATGDGQTMVVPTKEDGSSLSFSISRLLARIETAAASDFTVHVSLYTGSGAFSGSTIGTVTVSAGSHENTTTGLSGTVSSGNKLRLVFDTAPSGQSVFWVHLIGVTDLGNP